MRVSRFFLSTLKEAPSEAELVSHKLMLRAGLIRRLAGRSDCEPTIESAVLGCDLPENDERADYLRAALASGSDGLPIATPFPVQDSSMLTPLAKADCLLIREAYAPPAAAGSRCAIVKLGQ